MRARILVLAVAAVLAAGCSSTSTDEVTTDPPIRIVETHRVQPINSGR